MTSKDEFAELEAALAELRRSHDALLESIRSLRAENTEQQQSQERLEQRTAVLRYSFDRLEKTISDGAVESSRKSYSLEGEDLAIDNLFSMVLKQLQPGFYLDIGAAHPIKSSNTYFFYKLGWNGVCVEPNPDFHKMYKAYRPRDTVLNVGIAVEPRTLCYHRFEHAFINGFYGQDLVDWHINKNGQTYLGHSDIACMSIEELLQAHVNRPVDLLNIDVETLDAEILEAWRWDICHPTMICAEIHAHDIRHVLESKITKILENAGYCLVSRGWLSSIFVQTNKIERAKVIPS